VDDAVPAVGGRRVNDDPTAIQPVPYADPGIDRRLLFALLVAYMAAGGVLAFALLELEAVADQITTAPMCRRI